MQIDGNGDWVWARRFDGPLRPHSLAASTNGTFFVAGLFYSRTVFDSQTLVSSGTGAEIFVAKFGSGGQVIWARSYGGRYDDVPYKIAVTSSGEVFLTGYLTDNVFSSTNVIFAGQGPAGMGDAFLAKLNSTGDLIWIVTDGGPRDDWGANLVLDISGNCISTKIKTVPNNIRGGFDQVLRVSRTFRNDGQHWQDRSFNPESRQNRCRFVVGSL